MKSSEDINAINVDKSNHRSAMNSLNGSKRSNDRHESILKSGTPTFKPIEEQGKRILPTLADKQNLEIFPPNSLGHEDFQIIEGVFTFEDIPEHNPVTNNFSKYD